MDQPTGRSLAVCAANERVPAAHDGGGASNPQWSVIVIARNEAETIEKSLASVVRVFARHSYELIFVDSASTDGTVEIVRRFPAQILRLSETAPLRPSVGRHVGYRHSRGRWILFLDGDNVLVNPAWVDAAAEAFSADPRLGGVAGEMENLLSLHDPRTAGNYAGYPERDYQAADSLGGSAAYTREALENSGGGFNPFLRACEEAELGARLRKTGYSMRRLRMPMCQHYHKYPNYTVSEMLRRIRRGFLIGAGQYPRYCLSNRLPVPRPVETIIRPLAFLVLLAFGAAGFTASAITGQWRIFLAWVAGMLIAYLLFVIRRKEFGKPAYFFLEWGLSCLFIARGFLERPRSPNEFPELWRGRSVVAEGPREAPDRPVGAGVPT
jgi:GT2 family glycosyltransferase